MMVIAAWIAGILQGFAVGYLLKINKNLDLLEDLNKALKIQQDEIKETDEIFDAYMEKVKYFHDHDCNVRDKLIQELNDRIKELTGGEDYERKIYGRLMGLDDGEDPREFNREASDRDYKGEHD